MSRLLDKQLEKLGLAHDAPPDARLWVKFLSKICETYEAEAQDRYLLEQAIEVSSQDMRELME